MRELNPRLSTAPRWLFSALFLAVTTLIIAGCPIDLGDEPRIVSMNIDPSVISRSEVGMTDEYFNIELSTINFDEDITGVEVYIQLTPVRNAVGTVIVEGETILIERIAKTWFGGLEPGTYSIGAQVRTSSVTVRENNLATVVIED
ncbi:MAG: hypothetical protein H0U74_09590 [Bradymonadaceae bacterium]|nr:hypothetical protein [Lujinxingiaceae bacterium]